MKKITTLFVLFLLMSQIHTPVVAGVPDVMPADQVTAESPICQVLIPGGDICSNREFIQTELEALGANAFVEGLLGLLLDRACETCAEENFSLSNRYVQAFQRYLFFIENVDMCQRQSLSILVDFSSRQCGNLHSASFLVEASSEVMIAASECSSPPYLIGDLCDRMPEIRLQLEEVGVNFFIKRVLGRLLDLSCEACADEDFEATQFFTSAFMRYLDFVQNVDECARGKLIDMVFFSSRQCDGDFVPIRIMQDEVLSSLDSELRKVKDIDALEVQSDHLVSLLDKVGVANTAVLDDIEIQYGLDGCEPIKCSIGSICDEEEEILSALDDLGANVFVKRILTRLYEGACSACEAENFRMYRYYTRAFLRYLSFIRNTDRCAKYTLQQLVGGHSIRSCGSTPTDIINVDQMITLLDRQLGALERGALDDKGKTDLLDLMGEVEQAMHGALFEVRTELTIFPNPASQRVSLSNVVDHLQVINAAGVVVLSLQGVQEVNVEHLPAGMYTVRVQHDENQVTNLRLVKQ